MPDNSKHPIIQELLRRLIQSDPAHAPEIRSPFAKGGPGRKGGSDPHVGLDVVLHNQGEVNGGHPILTSPIDGQIVDFYPGLGGIVIQGRNPVTGTLQRLELLHSQAQFFNPKKLPIDVRQGQPVGTMGGVGAPKGAVHLHFQVIEQGDPIRTPQNPLKNLFHFVHPGEPVPQLSEFLPDTVPSRRQPPAEQNSTIGKHPQAKPDLLPASPPSSTAPLGEQGPAASNRQPPILPADKFGQPPTAKPRSNVGPPLDITPFQFRNPPTPGGEYGPRPDPTGSLYFSPQPAHRQFGPFTVPGPGSSETDVRAARTGSSGNSSIPMVSAPSRAGNGTAPAATPQTINAADQAGGDNDIGGAWASARQYMGGQAGRMAPTIAPAYQVPAAFPQNGAQPIGTLNGANQTGIFDPAASLVPLPRPRPPQAASWPSEPVAPLLQMPQAGAAAPEHPDWHDAGDWPQQGLPSWTQTQPAPQPALPVENLTTRVLRMKGVPEADIGAAINNPAKMQDLLNQLYGRRSTTAAGQDRASIYDRATQASPADQSDQASPPRAAAPENYLPFGWAGLPALLR